MLNGIKVLPDRDDRTSFILFVTNLTNQALGGTLLDKAKGKRGSQGPDPKRGTTDKTAANIFIQDFELDHENLKPNQGVLNRLESRPRVSSPTATKKRPGTDGQQPVNLVKNIAKGSCRRDIDRGKRIDAIWQAVP